LVEAAQRGGLAVAPEQGERGGRGVWRTREEGVDGSAQAWPGRGRAPQLRWLQSPAAALLSPELRLPTARGEGLVHAAVL
jgi:DNA-binding protein H-NS